MPVDTTIEHGTLPALPLVDETALYVQNLDLGPTREKREIKGGNAAVKALRFVNPIFRWVFSGVASAFSGLTDTHPGTKIVGGLSNYASSRYGFDPSEGMTIYEDPGTTLSAESEPQVTFTAVQYPLLTS